jgi:hypothetical protein
MIKRRSKYFWNDLELPFDLDSDPVFEHVSGDVVTAGFMVYDEDCRNPINDCDNGELVEFNRSTPSVDSFKRILRDSPWRVFTLRNYYPRGPYSSRQINGKKGDEFVADLLDYSDGYYICPEDASDFTTYTDSVFKEFRQWRDGECYGVCVWQWKGGEFLEDSRESECWGFIGYKHAKEELKSIFEATINREVTK